MPHLVHLLAVLVGDVHGGHDDADEQVHEDVVLHDDKDEEVEAGPPPCDGAKQVAAASQHIIIHTHTHSTAEHTCINNTRDQTQQNNMRDTT